MRKQHLDKLLGMFLQDEQFCKTYFKYTEKYEVFKVNPHKLVFDNIVGYMEEYGSLVSIDALEDELKHLADLPSSNPNSIDFNPTILHSFYVPEPVKMRAFYSDLLKDIIKETIRSQVRENATEEDEESTSFLMKQLWELKDIEKLGVVATLENPFDVDNPKDYIQEVQKISTGVGFIDRATNGGMAKGQTAGFLMPSKGGKTSLCCQTLGASVMNTKHAMYFQFEQELKGDISQRLYSIATQTPVSHWENEHALVSESVERWHRIKEPWKKYIKVIDYWVFPKNPMNNIGDIFKAVDEYNKALPKGEEVDLILIDWWRALELKLGVGSESENNKRDVRTNMQKEFVGYVQERGIRAMVFNQLTGAKANQKNPASMYDGIEDKSWGFFWNYIFVSNRPTEENNNVVKFKLDGARNAGQSTVKQKLDPIFRIFRDTNEEGVSDHMIEDIPSNTSESVVYANI